MLGQVIKRFLYKTTMGDLLVARGDPTSGTVYLTFDDGPHPRNTHRILDALRSARTKATFFLSGAKLDKCPEIGPLYVGEGHVVANHGYRHERNRYMDRTSVEREFRETQSAIETTCGRSSVLFRPPYGILNPAIARFSLRNRVPVVLWSVDSRDDASKNPTLILSLLEAVAPGDIVLFHEDCLQTADILEEWILRRKDSGIRFAPLEEGK